MNITEELAALQRMKEEGVKLDYTSYNNFIELKTLFKRHFNTIGNIDLFVKWLNENYEIKKL
ncbi:MAG TPA: hypothetical protein VIK77_02720 [Tissierellaceae bacterium]